MKKDIYSFPKFSVITSLVCPRSLKMSSDLSRKFKNGFDPENENKFRLDTWKKYAYPKTLCCNVDVASLSENFADLVNLVNHAS